MATNDADQFLATQVKLIGSDSVFRPVVDKFRLREVEKDALEEAVDKSADQPRSPRHPQALKSHPSAQHLHLPDQLPSANRQLAADVANEIAQSYLTHTYRIRYKATAGPRANSWSANWKNCGPRWKNPAPRWCSFERELNVINPEEKTNILSARLLELNSEYTKAQADRVKKEAAYNSVQDGTLEAAQASTQGEALKKLTEDFNEAEQKFAEVKNHYGINHPEYKKAQTTRGRAASRKSSAPEQHRAARRSRVSRGRQSRSHAASRGQETKTEFDQLNAHSFEYQTLKSEADGDKKLYEELIRKIKEAGINASFQNSSIRVADLARPGLKPVFPKMWLNVLLAFYSQHFLRCGVAVLGDVLDNTVRHPDQVTRLMNADVIGSLPAVKEWRRRLSPLASHL